MTFISDRYRIAFIHVPKTGGTSITEALVKAHGAELAPRKGNYAHEGVGQAMPKKYRPNGINVHDPWPAITEKYPLAATYQPIAVFRNPWARISSFYWHKRRRRDADLPRRPNGNYYNLTDTLRVSNVILLQPQCWWVPDHARVLLFDDFPSNLLELSGVLPQSIPIGRLNTRPGGDYDWRKDYDDYARRLIYNYYRWEIEQYGFTF